MTVAHWKNLSHQTQLLHLHRYRKNRVDRTQEVSLQPNVSTWHMQLLLYQISKVITSHLWRRSAHQIECVPTHSPCRSDSSRPMFEHGSVWPPTGPQPTSETTAAFQHNHLQYTELTCGLLFTDDLAVTCTFTTVPTHVPPNPCSSHSYQLFLLILGWTIFILFYLYIWTTCQWLSWTPLCPCVHLRCGSFCGSPWGFSVALSALVHRAHRHTQHTDMVRVGIGWSLGWSWPHPVTSIRNVTKIHMLLEQKHNSRQSEKHF